MGSPRQFFVLFLSFFLDFFVVLEYFNFDDNHRPYTDNLQYFGIFSLSFLYECSSKTMVACDIHLSAVTVTICSIESSVHRQYVTLQAASCAATEIGNF